MTTQGLEVKGPYDFTALRILDGNLQERASGTAWLRVPLDPGLYVVEARGPGALPQQEIVEVKAGVWQPVPEFEDELPTPLPALADQDVAGAVRVATRRPARSAAARFIGCAEAANKQLRDVRLVDRNRTPVAAAAETDWMRFGAAAVAVADIAAGVYGLEHEVTDLGARATAVLLRAGWETHAFIAWREGQPNLRFHMRPMGTGYAVDDLAGYARVDAAVEGLADGRLVLSPPMRRALVAGEVEDPMLALVGAYAWELDTAPEEDDRRKADLRGAARSVERLLPGTVDAEFLQLLVAHQDTSSTIAPFGVPPVLAVATERLLRLSADRQDLVAFGSWLENLSLRLTSGQPWTRWDADTPERAVRRAARRELVALSANLGDERIPALALAAGVPRSLVERFAGYVRISARGRLGRWLARAVLAARATIITGARGWRVLVRSVRAASTTVALRREPVRDPPVERLARSKPERAYMANRLLPGLRALAARQRFWQRVDTAVAAVALALLALAIGAAGASYGDTAASLGACSLVVLLVREALAARRRADAIMHARRQIAADAEWLASVPEGAPREQAFSELVARAERLLAQPVVLEADQAGDAARGSPKKQ